MGKKLIEVSLPLEAINKESAREKSIRHGHPSTLHLWWARRPLATTRAVLFAQLVDDPSAHPDRFPTDEDQARERKRLHQLIEQMVPWEATRDDKVMQAAREEILRSTGGNPPPILDPFAGGGAIPLEAQRLGLEAHASDLNPVAVLINKALIEIPPKFRDQPPVFPGQADIHSGWRGAEGLADDVRSYGEWMRDEAERRIGHLYPKATLDDGTTATVIAWIWARTVTCPNPACGIEMPLVRSFWLGKKKGKEAYVVPTVVPDPTHPSGQRVDFHIGHDPEHAPTKETDGTVSGGNASCLACGALIRAKDLRTMAQESGFDSTLMAVVAEGQRQRIYCPPTSDHVEAASVARPSDVPSQQVPYPNHDVDRLPMYGMPTWADAFTNRQLVALTTFSDLVGEARTKVRADATAAGLSKADAANYADAVATYLACSVSRMTNKSSSAASWDSSKKMEGVRSVFARQAIQMTWDYAEANPFAGASGDFVADADWIAKVLDQMPHSGGAGSARALNARSAAAASLLISTDPPYYDNIGYSDLSDFFYVWLRRSLRDVHPELFSTMLVPKAEELVANAYRHGGKEQAKDFFEGGFREVFAHAREHALDDYPITVYYAFKQSEATVDGTTSTGWETLLQSMIEAGWAITATWPVRSELSNRMLSQGTNALASSIVLSLRPRPADAPMTDRRRFLATLRAELPVALRTLQHGLIAPVDLPQAAIGPGMAVFSRYAQVLEPDGTRMTVRSALARINEILDEVLAEQEGDFDAPTRFAIAWYRQHGYATGRYGDADNLARARNTAVEPLDRAGILRSRAGQVRLLAPSDMPADYDVTVDAQTSTWEVCHHAIRLLTTEGAGATHALIRDAARRRELPVRAESVKELAFLLFSIAERNGWTQDALGFNQLATSWADIRDATPPAGPAQDTLAF